jgi:hypothetical protein
MCYGKSHIENGSQNGSHHPFSFLKHNTYRRMSGAGPLRNNAFVCFMVLTLKKLGDFAFCLAAMVD